MSHYHCFTRDADAVRAINRLSEALNLSTYYLNLDEKEIERTSSLVLLSTAMDSGNRCLASWSLSLNPITGSEALSSQEFLHRLRKEFVTREALINSGACFAVTQDIYDQMWDVEDTQNYVQVNSVKSACLDVCGYFVGWNGHFEEDKPQLEWDDVKHLFPYVEDNSQSETNEAVLSDLRARLERLEGLAEELSYVPSDCKSEHYVRQKEQDASEQMYEVSFTEEELVAIHAIFNRPYIGDFTKSEFISREVDYSIFKLVDEKLSILA